MHQGLRNNAREAYRQSLGIRNSDGTGPCRLDWCQEWKQVFILGIALALQGVGPQRPISPLNSVPATVMSCFCKLLRTSDYERLTDHEVRAKRE
jgi:hypothetical protein